MKTETEACIVCGRKLPRQDMRPVAVLSRGVAEQLRLDLPDAPDAGYVCRDDHAKFRRRYVERLLESERGELTRLDEDVLKFFQAMGAGYLTRINAVLRCFMLARLAGVVKGAAEVDHGQEARAEYLREMEAYMKEKPELDRLMALGGKAGDAAYAKASARLDRIQALLLGMLDGVVEDMEQG